MATITDIEMDAHLQGIASKSALKNYNNINTLSSGRISVHARSQTNMPAPQLKSVAMIGGGYFNTQLQSSVNGPNKNFTTPLHKQQHLPYGGVGSITQAQNNSLFNPNLYFDPNRQLMSRGSITSSKQNNNHQMPQLQQQPSITNPSRPQSQMQFQNSMMNPVSIISGNDNPCFQYHNSQGNNNLNSNQFSSRTSGHALGMSASAQQLRAAFSNTIYSQKQQAIGDTLMLQVLSSMNNYNSQPQFRTIGSSPASNKQSRVLMQNAATFKTSIESKYLLPTYNKLIKTDRITGKTKVSNSNLQSILVSTNSKKRMESALKMERQANMKHIGFKIGRFKKVKTINNNSEYEFQTRKSTGTRDSFNYQPNAMSFQKKRPPSPNPAEQWARSKGFKLEDYSKIKSAFHSKVDSHKQSRPRDSMVDFIGTMQLQRINIKDVLF